LGIEAPKDTKIHREEVYLAIQNQNVESATTSSDSTKAVAELLKSKS
jgi:carbon storage regulator